MFETGSIKLIILDFDGVIVESNNVKDLAFEKIFNRFPEHSHDFMQHHRQYVSTSRYAKFDYVLEKLGRTGDKKLKDQLAGDFSKLTLELMKSVSFVNGAKEFLADLYGKIPLYLASVTPIEDLEIILEHLQIRSFFKDVYGCPPWNKPDAIRDILKKEKQTHQTAVLIGDSYGDQRAASETGVFFIGRESGLGFEEPYPAYIIPDLAGFSALFTNHVQ
jgi:phosphoglycolate phosphatase-like HAD superfamily hydrolase